MLTSPLQWPFLVAGIAGMVVITWSALRAARLRDARRLLRLNSVSLNVSFAALAGLLVIDFAAIYAVGRTQMIGLRYALVMIVWMVVILIPVGLRTKRIRRRRGWAVPWDAGEPDAGESRS